MNKFTKLGSFWLALLLLAVLAGCGGNNADSSDSAAGSAANAAASLENSSAANGEKPASAADGTAAETETVYPLTLTDATGTEVTFDAKPERMISLAPSETETLFALGLDQEIVGVSDNDDYPEAAKSKPKMGGFEINAEAVIAAKPDVVFAAGITSADTIKSLRGLGIKVFQFNPKTIEDVTHDVQLYGQITNRLEAAREVTDKMNAELEQVKAAVKDMPEDQKKNVYIEFSPGWTVGKGEFMDEMVNLAGGINIAADMQGWFEINEETIIKANPDVILYGQSVVDEKGQTLEQIIKARSGWDQIQAIKEGRVVGLDDNLISRTGPRVTEGLLQVAKAIYPDLFK